jgi:3-hydroxyisobutyrate dehydrogenase-like beta-hydroxyacid dehydrogenase|tara:strand:+ start:823 stop:1686 length:864 start_codon:yes stop_codon:yes gene_type:complete
MIGLGLMGSTLATHLQGEGHTVVGYDPNHGRRREHVRRGGVSVESIADAVVSCSLAILSLPNSSTTIAVCNEIVEAAPSELLVIDTTTGDPSDSFTGSLMLASIGARYVDATVSGNAAQAAVKDIIFMIGGAAADVTRAAAVLEPLGRQVYRVGPLGAGMRAKIVVNHILYINRAAIAEGLAVAEKAGLELEPMFQVLRDSAAYSKAMDIWGQRMIDGDFNPPASRVRQSLKDARLINAHAESIGASHALVEVVRAALVDAVDGGLADEDNASVMEVMRRRAGIGRC